MIPATNSVPSTITSFDGGKIEGSIGKNGVFAAFDWENMILPPAGSPILEKAKVDANKRLDGFPYRDHKRLVEKLGHYSDVQSINSEDTVTGSVFGLADHETWLNDVLTEVFGPAERPKSWEVKLWSRIPHPLTGQTEHGPESDVLIQNAECRYVVEAKWTADISVHLHGENQIEMRAYQAQLGNLSSENCGVIVVVPSPARYKAASTAMSTFRRYFEIRDEGYSCLEPAKKLNAKVLTWERLGQIIGARGRPKLQAYMHWRLSQIR